jgi:hypothetical protein
MHLIQRCSILTTTTVLVIATWTAGLTTSQTHSSEFNQLLVMSNHEDYLNRNDSFSHNNFTTDLTNKAAEKFFNNHDLSSQKIGNGYNNEPNSFFIHHLLSKILIGCIVYSITVWTIIGNIFVCIAILTNKQLKQNGMSNFLIGNLAISDLLLGLTVLPFSATLTTFKTWVFGKVLCDLWLSIDVLCSTASIWGLLVISLDRYIATNHPLVYRNQQTKSVRIVLMYCTFAWLISFGISLAPLLVGADPSGEKSGLRRIANTTDEYECVLFQTPSFVILSSLFSFYMPLVLMFVLYAGVFLRIRQKSKLLNRNTKKKSSTQSATGTAPVSGKSPHAQSITSASQTSEARITKTLAIIMGVFVACWLPFFTIYIIRSQLANPDSIPGHVLDVFIWLGYFNSAINPVLYAILNANFRTAFQDILAGRCFNTQQKNNRMYKMRLNQAPATAAANKQRQLSAGSGLAAADRMLSQNGGRGSQLSNFVSGNEVVNADEIEKLNAVVVVVVVDEM